MNTIVATNYSTLAAFGKMLETSCYILDRYTLGLSVIYSENEDGSPGTLTSPCSSPRVHGPSSRQSHRVIRYWPRFSSRLGHINRCRVWNILDYHYVSPAGEYINDWGYGIHFDALYESTDGCFHLYSAADARWLAQQIGEAQEAGEAVQITVA